VVDGPGAGPARRARARAVSTPAPRYIATVLCGVLAAVSGAPFATATAGATAPRADSTSASTASSSAAYAFLDLMMDQYAKGKTLRLVQSFQPQPALDYRASVTYDDALVIDAYLASPTPAHLRRAQVIGDSLLYVQANDAAHDGRVRAAYAPTPLRTPARITVTSATTSVGNLAWVGMALARLHAQTGEARYLDGAVAAATWIQDHTYDTRGAGGYTGGQRATGEDVTWKSTEHNIDAYALCTLLAKLTRARRWVARADVAADFVRAMWNRAGRFFWTGTLGGVPGEDPNVINTGNIPEDVQTWSLLALGDGRYESSVDWVTRKLSNTDGGPSSQLPAGVTVSGVTYSTGAKTITGTVSGSDLPNNRTAVWLEGTGHTALALLERDNRGDAEQARRLLHETVVAQEQVGGGQTVGLTSDPDAGRLSDPGAGGTWTGTPLPARSGIVAATSAFDTGFGFGYFQRQHVGATSWFLMAAQNFNPYRCGM
jgi:hypothetical protein